MDNLIKWVKENVILVAAAVAAYFLFIKKK
jgi:hypothetical protein